MKEFADAVHNPTVGCCCEWFHDHKRDARNQNCCCSRHRSDANRQNQTCLTRLSHFAEAVTQPPGNQGVTRSEISGEGFGERNFHHTVLAGNFSKPLGPEHAAHGNGFVEV